MNRADSPYDNAAIERYYNTLKKEHINLFVYKIKGDLDLVVKELAYVWYNHCVRIRTIKDVSLMSHKLYTLVL